MKRRHRSLSTNCHQVRVATGSKATVVGVTGAMPTPAGRAITSADALGGDATVPADVGDDDATKTHTDRTEIVRAIGNRQLR